MITKTVEMSPVEILERLLGDEAEEYEDILEEYRDKCREKVRVDLILGRNEFEIRTNYERTRESKKEGIWQTS